MAHKIGWKCRHPIRVPVRDYLQELACNRCLPCLIRRERSWVFRQKLEQAQSSASYFVTLTYSDQHRLGTLHYEHVQQFLKLLRRSVRKVRVRFFCSGEYGELRGREHWHLNIFSTANLKLRAGQQAIEQWRHGAIFVGTLTQASMGYAAKYVVEGKPAITQMSRRPGLGVPGIRRLAQRMCDLNALLEDIPTSLVVGKDRFPLDRTMRFHFLDAFLQKGGALNVKGAPLKIYCDRPETLLAAIDARGTSDFFRTVDLKTERMLAEEKHGTPF